MAASMPTSSTRWRCTQCGNLTRFDVVRSARVREYVHLDLAGERRVEEAEVLSETVERVLCRWCGSTSVDVVPRVAAEPAYERAADAAPRAADIA